MPARYAWLTFACVLCVLNVSWCRAADDDEHVHIKVRMPELVRKHKTHKPSQHHYHNYHQLPHQHHYHKPHHPHAQYTNPAAKHGRRAVKPTAPAPPLPPAMLPHNQLDMGLYGDEWGAGVGGVGMANANGLRGGGSDQLLYSPGAPQPMALPPGLAPNYGPALFGGAPDGSSAENNQQHAMLSMPSSTQHLMQHMELMGALAAAAAAAAGGGAVGNEAVAAGVGGGGASETTNTHLADDFLAQMQHTYANGKFPTMNSKHKKKYRGNGLAEIGDAAALTFPLNTPQLQQQHIQQQQQQHQQLLRQQFQQQQQQQQKQQFYGANYYTQQPKPLAQMLRAPTNYHSAYQQQLHYKNKQRYNNNGIYATATTDDDIGNDSSDADASDDADDGDEDDDNDNADDATMYFSSRPTIHAPTHSTVAAYNGANDYADMVDDEEQQQFGYNSNSNGNNHYKHNYFDGVVDGDANEGVNPVSYQSTTGYGAYATSASTPAAVTHLKLRPNRQLPQQQRQRQRPQKHKHAQQQQQYSYTSQEPSGFAGHQQLQLQPPQQQLITTAQPINVVGPTASDFDDEHPPPPAQQQQQHHKYPVSPRYKKRENRIKAKSNRNRIPTQ